MTKEEQLKELLAKAKEDILSREYLGETRTQRYRCWIFVEKYILETAKLYDQETF